MIVLFRAIASLACRAYFVSRFCPQPHPLPKDIPPPIRCPLFVEDIRHYCVAISDDPADRLMRSHGLSTAKSHASCCLTTTCIYRIAGNFHQENLAIASTIVLRKLFARF